MMGFCSGWRGPDAAADGLPADARPELEMRFPMWLLPVDELMRMSGSPPCHQELRSAGKLVRWTPGLFVVFVSHQWLSYVHPDPGGKQLEHLRQALQGLLAAGSTAADAEVAVSCAGQAQSRLRPPPPIDPQRIKQGHLWYDYFSVPQPVPQPDPNAGNVKWEDTHFIAQEMQLSVESLPAYVSRSSVFLALCPEVRHIATGELCGYRSWLRRGWCRLEMLSWALSTWSSEIVLLRSAGTMRSANLQGRALAPVGEGRFATDSDRDVLRPVVEDLVERVTFGCCEAGGALGLLRYRCLSSLRQSLLRGLTLPKPTARVHFEGDQCATMMLFLHRLQFSSYDDAHAFGLTPLHCAAIQGNIPVMRRAVQAGGTIHGATTHNVPVFNFVAGTTPLDLAVLVGGAAAVAALLELRATAHCQNAAGISPLHYAVSACCQNEQVAVVSLLLDHCAKVDDPGPLGASALNLAAALLDADVVEVLLLRRGDANARAATGAAPLHQVALLGGGHEEVIRALARHGADLNLQAQPPSALQRCAARWGALGAATEELVALSLGLQWPMDDFPAGAARAAAEVPGATPLAAAALMGRADLCQALLGLKADPTICNANGRSPLDLATMFQHRRVAAALLVGPTVVSL